MENAQTIPEWRTAADEIWAMMKETDRRMKETDRRIEANARLQEKTDQQIKENIREMRESSSRLDKQLGKLGNRFGEMVEYMVMPNLVTKFNELGLSFTKAYHDAEIKDTEHSIFTEVDVFLENGDKVMIVEIKNKPNVDDINEHIERMEKLRKYADLHNDQRKYRGAVAGVVFGGSEKTYTLKKGFYVIEPSGDTFNIISPTGDYYPREW